MNFLAYNGWISAIRKKKAEIEIERKTFEDTPKALKIIMSNVKGNKQYNIHLLKKMIDVTVVENGRKRSVKNSIGKGYLENVIKSQTLGFNGSS